MTENKSQRNIITIDGPAGSGKSTIAHALAKRLRWVHVNTGAIYRTFAWIMSEFHPTVDSTHLTPDIINQVASTINSEYSQNDTNHQFFLNTKNITENIYAPHISNLSSVYGQNKLVREALLPIQRKIIEEHDGVIVDGRDMGTVVFPFAPLKIFLTANVETRAKRRVLELQTRGLHVNFDVLLKEIQERDLRDSTRDASPSKPALDAIVIDSSTHSVDEIVDKIFLLYYDLQESNI